MDVIRPRAPAPGAPRHLLTVGACLLVFLAATYWQALSIPFLGDDYVILDKVRPLSFFELWRPRQLLFDWYRPWSREFHYWLLLHTVGLREPLYHLASFALWLVALLLYHQLVRRLTKGPTAAAIATAGLAALFLWGAPLLWIAGVQDLWMLVFSLCFLHAFVRGWTPLALVALLLALLSKETAVVLPGVAFAWVAWAERRGWRTAARRTAGCAALVAAWAALHPTLAGRLLGVGRPAPVGESHATAPGALGRMLLAQVNLDAWPAPSARVEAMLLGILVGGAALAALVLLTARGEAGAPRGPDVEPPPALGRLVAFGALWAALGWSLLVLPSIGWHAYYGSLGALGFWLAAGVLLGRRRRLAVAVVVALVAVGQARASTVSWDWGTYWYQRRAGNFLGGIRARLFELHPTLPTNSWLYFAVVPNNIGFLGGDGPALRTWYRDPTVHASFLSEYGPRAPADPAGRDFFFRFDLRDTLVEMAAGPESSFTFERHTPAWRHDRAVLASTFLGAGDVAAAARQYATLWVAYPDHPLYALFAACAAEAQGDTLAAREMYQAARAALGDSVVRARAPGYVREAKAFRAAARFRTE